MEVSFKIEPKSTPKTKHCCCRNSHTVTAAAIKSCFYMMPLITNFFKYSPPTVHRHRNKFLLSWLF